MVCIIINYKRFSVLSTIVYIHCYVFFEATFNLDGLVAFGREFVEHIFFQAVQMTIECTGIRGIRIETTQSERPLDVLVGQVFVVDFIHRILNKTHESFT